MNQILYLLTPNMASSLGGTSMLGAAIPFVYAILSAIHDDEQEMDDSVLLVFSSAIALSGGLSLIDDANYYSMNDSIQYIQSLSNEELAELADELALISDNQKTDELVQQMDLIEQTELAGGVDSDSLSLKRQEVISNYLGSLTIGEINEIYSELDNVTNLLPPEEKLEKQLSLIKK